MASHANMDTRNDGQARAGKIMQSAFVCATGVSAFNELPIHAFLAKAWSSDPRASDLLRRALILCADHELNASTYAARVAASAGASLPASLLAGLATLSGNRHGGLTTRCRAWMDEIDEKLSNRDITNKDVSRPPGFGHPLYPDGDPRAKALLEHCPVSEQWDRTIERVSETTGLAPGLDFALAHLERELKLPKGGGIGIFALGRLAGWMAHIFEQRQTGRIIRPRAATPS